MKLLASLLFSLLLLVGCSGDPEVSSTIEGGWKVKVAKLNVNLNQGELAIKNVSAVSAVAPRYLDQKSFVETLQLLLNESHWEFFSSGTFKITYPVNVLNANQKMEFTGTFSMKNSNLEKSYNGSLSDRSVMKGVSIYGDKMVLNLTTKADFLSAFGYEMPTIVYQTAEDMMVSIEIELEATRE